jgi:sugar lactone lactonase YvrE
MTYPVPRDWGIDLGDLQVAGRGFDRPECVLALSNGELIASNGAGGYSVLRGDGVQHVLGRSGDDRRYVPNGIALAPDGRVLFADLGAEQGGVFAIEPGGLIEPVVTEIGGAGLPPSNFVTVDASGTLWLTVSTRQRPRSFAWTPEVSDGFIAVMDQHGTRLVADGLAYANEVAFSPDGRWVYVNETYGQRLSRFEVLPGPALGPKEVVAEFGGADLPDGVSFDVHGGAWVTCIASNRLLLVRPDGEVQEVLADTDPNHAHRVAEAIRQRSLDHATMQTAGRSGLGNISSLAFGGADLTTAYLGCLLDDRIRSFRSPVQEHPQPIGCAASAIHKTDFILGPASLSSAMVASVSTHTAPRVLLAPEPQLPDVSYRRESGRRCCPGPSTAANGQRRRPLFHRGVALHQVKQEVAADVEGADALALVQAVHAVAIRIAPA